MMSKHVFLIGGILIAGVAAAVIAHVLLKKPPTAPLDLLGERMYDPQLKLAYRPPAQWRITQASPELAKRFADDQRRLIAHFEGPNPGDQADLIAFKSPDRLRQVREQVLAQQKKMEKRAIGDEFLILNTVPAWVYEYVARQGTFASHTICVVLDRGDRKVVLSCTGSPKSVAEQRRAILESIKNIKLE